MWAEEWVHKEVTKSGPKRRRKPARRIFLMGCIGTRKTALFIWAGLRKRNIGATYPDVKSGHTECVHVTGYVNEIEQVRTCQGPDTILFPCYEDLTTLSLCPRGRPFNGVDAPEAER